MNHLSLVLALPMCLALGWNVSRAATLFWDLNGATPGAGGPTPSGLWDTTTANWSTDANGAVTTIPWTDGDNAVFSAGTDATGDFTVTIDVGRTAGNLTVEEGNITFGDATTSLTVGDSSAGKGIINIASNSTVTLDTQVAGGDDTGVLNKTGAGTLILSQGNPGLGGFLVKEGVLGSANNAALAGSVTVSNGAAVHLMSPSTGYGSGTPIVLNGEGPDGTGALRKTSTNSITFSAGAILGSDARIQNDAPGNFDWVTMYISGTNGGNNWNLTLGGNGGRIRMNQASPYNRAINVGTGTVTKVGSCLLQIENPWICSAFYFNGGNIFPRYSGFGQGNIYVAPTANAFQALPNTSCTVFQPMVLAAGANIKFDVRTNTSGAPLSFTCTGVISGPGGLTKIQAGTLLLTAANTYSGNTVIQEGILTLGSSGSISNSAVIDIQGSNAIFQVSGLAGGFVLQPAQTLQGNGTVQGNVIALGTLAPGSSIGILTNDGNLTLAGTVRIELDKSGAPSNDQLHVTGSLSHSGGGSIQVLNLGPALAPGDSFQIFNQPVLNGQTMSVSGAGAVWTNRLAVDGSIAVLSVSPPVVPATNLTLQVSGPNARALSGQGAANSAYYVYASTNVTLPMSNWWLIGVTNSDAGGLIQFVDTGATNAQRFYRFGQPSP